MFTTTTRKSSCRARQILTLDCLFPLKDTFLTLRCIILLLWLTKLAWLLRLSRPPFCLTTAVKEIPLDDLHRNAGTKHGPTWRTKQKDRRKKMTVLVQRYATLIFYCRNVIDLSLFSFNWKPRFSNQRVSLITHVLFGRNHASWHVTCRVEEAKFISNKSRCFIFIKYQLKFSH